MKDNGIGENRAHTHAMDALRKLARFRSVADDALDIHLLLSAQECPGSCLKCFFNLSRKAPEYARDEVQTVRQWLESQLVVVARNPEKCELCSFPCQIKETSMEEYCERVMQEAWHRFADCETLVSLELRYAAAPADTVGA